MKAYNLGRNWEEGDVIEVVAVIVKELLDHKEKEMTSGSFSCGQKVGNCNKGMSKYRSDLHLRKKKRRSAHLLKLNVKFEENACRPIFSKIHFSRPKDQARRITTKTTNQLLGPLICARGQNLY